MLFDSHSCVDFLRPIYLPRMRGLRRNTKGQLGFESECECLVFGKLQVSKPGGIILGRSGKVPSLASTSISGAFQPYGEGGRDVTVQSEIGVGVQNY